MFRALCDALLSVVHRTDEAFYKNVTICGEELEAPTSIFTKNGPNSIGFLIECVSAMAKEATPASFAFISAIVIHAYFIIRSRLLISTETVGEKLIDSSYPDYLAVVFRSDFPLETDLPAHDYMEAFVRVSVACAFRLHLNARLSQETPDFDQYEFMRTHSLGESIFCIAFYFYLVATQEHHPNGEVDLTSNKKSPFGAKDLASFKTLANGNFAKHWQAGMHCRRLDLLPVPQLAELFNKKHSGSPPAVEVKLQALDTRAPPETRIKYPTYVIETKAKSNPMTEVTALRFTRDSRLSNAC